MVGELSYFYDPVQLVGYCLNVSSKTRTCDLRVNGSLLYQLSYGNKLRTVKNISRPCKPFGLIVLMTWHGTHYQEVCQVLLNRKRVKDNPTQVLKFRKLGLQKFCSECPNLIPIYGVQRGNVPYSREVGRVAVCAGHIARE